MTPHVSTRPENEHLPRARRPRVLWAGLGLLAVGLVILGYVGWQLIGTNIVSERRQAELVEQLQQQWRAPSGTEPEAAPHAGPDVGGPATALVRIPRFGDNYVMPMLEGIGDYELSRGFGHYENSSDPGDVGNYAISAHRTTHGEPLREMPSLRPGDAVVIETRDAVYTYELDTNPNDLNVTFGSTWVLADRPINPDPDGVQPAGSPRLITMTTCSELFHTDYRMVVFGHLVERRAR